MTNETMTKNGKYRNDQKMRKIEAIDFFGYVVIYFFQVTKLISIAKSMVRINLAIDWMIANQYDNLKKQHLIIW